MGTSKAKGTAAEVALVGALQRLGWPYAERRALSGVLDKGDTTGHPGLMFECKDAKTWKAAAWLRETETERGNAKADYGILVVKVPGIGYPKAEKWLTVMDDEDACRLHGHANLRYVFPEPPAMRVVTLKAVGLKKGLVELAERERHCGLTPVMVRVAKTLTAANPTPGYYNLMRLDARCKLLIDAGYGGYAIMDAITSSIVKENDDG